MGILNLAKLLADVAPQALKENELKTYFGKGFRLIILAIN